jgi:hypothetical protein
MELPDLKVLLDLKDFKALPVLKDSRASKVSQVKIVIAICLLDMPTPTLLWLR